MDRCSAVTNLASSEARKATAFAIFRLHPAPLANLTLREVTVGDAERFLTGVAKGSGEGAARTTRTVLRGVLDLATKHDAIPHNPVRSAGPINVRTTKRAPATRSAPSPPTSKR